ncbi:MAG: cobalamin B12-binding domain-containing protein [Anaerolineae bacterium]|nr:cobalamin B12-binding domain-containing protein [Anaerolineae bacterium]
MSSTDPKVQLINAIAELNEDTALALVRERISAGDDPLLILEDCQEGMRRVGERYEQGQYYLAGLVMGGEIFRQVMALLQPVVESQISGEASGKILLGTVQGDIHDLGKNIANMLLSCHKFTVYDLGVDVPPEEFARRAQELQPDIIGLSGLLTSSYDSMRETVASLRAEGCQAPIIIGGGQLTEQVCQYVEADYWTNDAVTAVELCQRLVAKRASSA